MHQNVSLYVGWGWMESRFDVRVMMQCLRVSINQNISLSSLFIRKRRVQATNM